MTTQNNTKFSTAEMAMFMALGYIKLLQEVDPITLYRLAGEDCFINNRSGYWVECLRRGLRELKRGKIFRLTDEWNNVVFIHGGNLTN